MRWDIMALACAAILFLSVQYTRERARQRRIRGEFFADCLTLFQSARVIQDDLQFPVLTGRYKDFEIRLEPIVDEMTMRKLPSLWLKVTLFAPVRYAGALDLLIRARGNEFFSPAFDLPVEIKRPQGWPVDIMVRSDDPSVMPPEEAVAPHLHLFDDLKMKELLIAPRGVRLLYQADQADRGHYAVLRRCDFGAPRLAPELARRLLEAVESLYRSVAVAPAQAVAQPEMIA